MMQQLQFQELVLQQRLLVIEQLCIGLLFRQVELADRECGRQVLDNSLRHQLSRITVVAALDALASSSTVS